MFLGWQAEDLSQFSLHDVYILNRLSLHDLYILIS